ncbi:cyclic pyranopterin monophosphate synthase [Candidatus Methanoplasma termitum]|uniref:MoaA3 protein n=1 Tax=Candidatus Methanoplasma termitum TaxID=1577791 RepID=A0A0A7LAH2_9ARCH|nr:radical SAM protein [Candidatus Methanoplasma termitum]AIZ56064.1 cyclic pyranopterin monophosphate synthase [Candidatus Methanoplasma termitum]MCL2333602.1 radical SAM protein [Candidatus Methanoplasma sp.]
MTSTMQNYAVKKGLPKQTRSVCPECGKILDATLYDKGGKVFMDKTCPEHGKFCDVYWSDTELFLRAEEFAHDGIGLRNPMDKNLKEGENVHVFVDGERVDMLTCSALANIDLTNRCNMNCPICFANANQQGYIYEPDYETLTKMLDALRAEEPIKCTAVQFSGGEPTIHPDFVKIIKAAKDKKFAQVQVATNGITFARRYDILKDASAAGLNSIYLSFDGLTDDIYLQARDRKMFQVKIDVITNCRKLKEETGVCPSIVLVPTVVRGMNDDQIGDMVKFAFDNADIVRGINFQPVAFTGRMTREELEKGRFTLPDLIEAFGEQTGYTTKDDWYPVPVVAPISDFASIILNENKVTFTTHPHCGVATYVFMDENGKVTPFPRFINVKEFTKGLEEIAAKAEKATFKKLYALKLLKLLDRSIIEENLPGGMNKKQFKKMMASVMSKRSKTALAAFSWKVMFFGGMHFQDSHNYDVERVRRCGVHYVTPDCQVIPFCAYNGGPEYRNEIEKKFSVPLAEWKEKNKKEAAELEAAMVVPDDQKA